MRVHQDTSQAKYSLGTIRTNTPPSDIRQIAVSTGLNIGPFIHDLALRDRDELATPDDLRPDRRPAETRALASCPVEQAERPNGDMGGLFRVQFAQVKETCPLASLVTTFATRVSWMPSRSRSSDEAIRSDLTVPPPRRRADQHKEIAHCVKRMSQKL
jgi:hypothetical protein